MKEEPCPDRSFASDQDHIECPACKGRRTITVKVTKECPECLGTGTILGRPCPVCNGNDSVVEIEDERTCLTCLGTGFIAT
jgi:DnaJ-class molecular chaperone